LCEPPAAYLVTSYQAIKNKNPRNFDDLIAKSGRQPAELDRRFDQPADCRYLSDMVQRPNKYSTRAPDADRLSWKTTRHFRRMLRARTLAAQADALKNIDMTDPG
jgi:hypothetical protein